MKYKFFQKRFFQIFIINMLTLCVFSLTIKFADLVKMLGGSIATAGTLLAVGVLVAIYFKRQFSKIVDLVGFRKVWLASFCLLGSGSLLIGFCEEIGWSLILGRIFLAVGYASCIVCNYSYVQSIVPSRYRSEAVSLFGISTFLGLLSGSAILDLSNFINQPDNLSLHISFYISGGIAFACLPLIALIQINHEAIQKKYIPRLFGDLSLRKFAWLFLGAMAMGGAFSIPQLYLASYASERSISYIGIFFIGYAAASIACRILGRRLFKALGPPFAIALGMFAFGLSLCSYMLVGSAWQFIIPGILAGVGRSFAEPALVTLGGDSIAVASRAHGTAMIMLFIDLGLMLFSVVFGWVIDHYSFQMMFLTAGTVCFVSSFLASVNGVRVWLHRRSRLMTPKPSIYDQYSKIKILVAASIPDGLLNHLYSVQNFSVVYLPNCDRVDLLYEVEQTDILLCHKDTRIDAEVLDRAQNLSVLGVTEAGVDQIDRELVFQKAIKIFNVPEDKDEEQLCDAIISGIDELYDSRHKARRVLRDKISMPVLLSDGKKTVLQLRDYDRQGMGVECGLELAIGEVVCLRLDHRTYELEVVWTVAVGRGSYRSGLKSARALADQDFIAFRKYSERRLGHRFEIPPTTLTFAGYEKSVAQINDVSLLGVQVIFNEELAVGSLQQINFASEIFDCEVLWCEFLNEFDCVIGLRFTGAAPNISQKYDVLGSAS